MQVGTERSTFHASQFAEGLFKQLDGPSLWFVLGPKSGSNLGPKEGSIGREGREVRDEVPGQNWHFRHFHPIRVKQEGTRKACFFVGEPLDFDFGSLQRSLV